MAMQEATVDELVRMISHGELRLPEMQRRYVWRSSRVRDLLDSLYREYPSGTILIWEAGEQVPLQDMAVSQEKSGFKSTRLLLDGQQRLTSLSAVISGERVKVRGRRKPIELLFNLEHPDKLAEASEVEEDGAEDEDEEEPVDGEADETDSSEDELQKRFDQKIFVVSTRKLEQLPKWVKVTDVFKSTSDAAFLERAGVTSLKDPNFTRYSQRLAKLRAIRNYKYRMDVLDQKLPYEEVTEIFVRVNSLGAKLRSSDLALAQITAMWRNSLAIFEKFQEACAKKGFYLDLGLLLKNLVVFATGQSRFQTVGNLKVEDLKAGWIASRKGMEFALNFACNNTEIDCPALLSSPFLLITVAYFGYKRGYELSPSESDRLRYWVLVANAKGRYSRGSSETLLDQDIASIRGGSRTKGLIDRLRLQVGRLDVTPGELEGRNQRSALFKTMFLAFRARGAKDWRSQVAIALDHSGSEHRLQFHHIFPKAILKGRYTSREADDICNLCFIAGKTNRQISVKSPDSYFPQILAKSGQDVFKAQCIPMDKTVLGINNYMAFLAKRRLLIAKCLNEFLGS